MHPPRLAHPSRLKSLSVSTPLRFFACSPGAYNPIEGLIRFPQLAPSFPPPIVLGSRTHPNFGEQAGLTGDWANRRIFHFTARNSVSGTYGVFRNIVLAGATSTVPALRN